MRSPLVLKFADYLPPLKEVREGRKGLIDGAPKEAIEAYEKYEKMMEEFGKGSSGGEKKDD